MSSKPSASKAGRAPRAGFAEGAVKVSAAGEAASLVANGRLVAMQLKAVVAMALVTLLALVAAAWSMSGALSAKQLVVSLDAQGRVMPVVPITQPYLSESRVVAFAEECIRRAWAHDFIHYESTLPLAQNCFTPEAGDLYMQAIAPYIKTMKEKRMVMGALVTRVPRVVRFMTEPSVGGPIPVWKIEAEIGVFFEGKGERITPSRSLVELAVRRVPLESSPRGVQIDLFFVKPV